MGWSCQGAGRGENMELLSNGCRNCCGWRESSGNRRWWWLHNNVNVCLKTEEWVFILCIFYHTHVLQLCNPPSCLLTQQGDKQAWGDWKWGKETHDISQSPAHPPRLHWLPGEGWARVQAWMGIWGAPKMPRQHLVWWRKQKRCLCRDSGNGPK